jgi:DNA damage-binding protein 1
LIPVYGTDRFSGGLIVLGGREIQFFDTSRNKNKGIEIGKRNSEGDRSTSRKEHGSQKQVKRRKAKATVLWPWDEFSA